MSKSEAFYAAFLLLSVFVSSISQVLLKKSAMEKHGSVIEEYLNPKVIIAYAIFFGATFLSMYAYKGIPLSLGPVLEATGYFYVTFFGARFFGEKVTKRKIAALALIILGIAVYTVV